MSSTVDIFNDFDMTNVIVAMMQYVLNNISQVIEKNHRKSHFEYDC